MAKNPFVAAPFFFLRTTTWPIEDYEHLLEKENWIEALIDLYESDQFLREAIFIASPSLYHSLQQKPLKNPKQVALSLFNYVIRMTTRPTPFGLFSCVTSGSWTQQTEIDFEIDKIVKIARPDMEWVFALVQKIYSDKELFFPLPVKTNPLVNFRGGRYCLEYIRYFETNELLPKIFSIQDTQLVRNILLFAKEPIKTQDLWEKLKSNMPFLDQGKTLTVVESLLKQQFILPGLLPSLLDLTSLDNFLMNLPEKFKGKDLLSSIHTYNKLKAGKGESLLQQLQNDMKAKASSKTFLQIDSVYENRKQSISKKVVEEVEKTLAILWKISTALTPSIWLKDYREKFIEKYGSQRTVPLMELLSENKGLGPHDKIITPMSASSKFSEEWQKWLSCQWQKCLLERKNEIIITEKSIDDLFKQTKEQLPDPKHALLSFDVFCKILAESAEKIDNGEFLLFLSENNWQGGSALGRFMHLFSKEFREDLKGYLHKEEQLDKEALFVELSYWPPSIRNANVAIQPCLRAYRLDIEEKNRKKDSLLLSDIYVGVLADRFYLTLKDGGLEIVPCFGNFLNPGFAPLPFRFMREVTLSRNQLLHPFSWEKSVKNAVFFPRVRFQKTVLSPAQWNLDAKQFFNQKLEKIISTFTLWADQWKLPYRFFMAKNDHHLLLDRKHRACLQLIAQKLRKGESLKLIEAFDSSWMKSKRGSHLAEIVIPFLKNPIYSNKKKSFSPLPHKSIPFEKRFLFPGSEWLFIKFYLEEESIERFLVQHLSQFADYLNREEGGLGWFFVRYNDPGYHLRFRMRFQSPEFATKAIGFLEEVSKDWMERGLIKNIVFSVYEKEVERYGGLDFIEDAESVFFQDTLATTNLLQALLTKSISFQPSVVQTVSAINFLRDFKFNDDEIILFLSNLITSRKELEGFREHRNLLINLLKEQENHSEDFLSAKAMETKKASKQRIEIFHLFNSKLKNLSSAERFNVYSSMLHLHCNRLGCDAKEEKRAYLYARQALIQLKHLRESEHAERKQQTPKIQRERSIINYVQTKS